MIIPARIQKKKCKIVGITPRTEEAISFQISQIVVNRPENASFIKNGHVIAEMEFVQIESSSVDHSGLEPLTSPMPWVRSTR